MSGYYGTPSNAGRRRTAIDCSTNPAHNRWVTVASGLSLRDLPAECQHQLRSGATLNVGAENLFSIWVQSGGHARVYGAGRMAAYTNLAGGLQTFYFAQIEREHAGKTMVIELFDPGEVDAATGSSAS